MSTSGNAVLYVTFIEKRGSFIKIWGQPDRSSPLIIKKTLLQITPQFDQGMFTPTFENIHAGNVLYCAKYVDGSYYRVRITSIQSNFLEVHFVDFGNKELVSIMNLRMIPNVAPVLITIAPQAKEFILANVTHHGSSWDTSTLSLISNEIRFCELTYSVVSQLGNCMLIKLFRNFTEDFALSLFNRGIVLSIALTAQHMILQSTSVEGVSPPCTPSVPVVDRQPPIATTRVTQPPPSQPPAILTYKGAVIEPGAQYQVYISYVCDGPCQFSVQLQKSEDNLVRLMKELNSMTLQPLEDFPMPGTVCVARCAEDDHICRAVITNMVDSQYKVFYVDFGNTEVVPIDNLFQIPFKYVIPKVMATRYALAGLDKSSVTIEMKCAFKEFVSNKLLLMHTLAAPARSSLPLCNLFDENNINVLEVLQRAATLAYPEISQLTRGFSHDVHVSYVHSCSRFFVQIKGKEQDLTNLMNNLQKICANGQKLKAVRVGLPCCALFEEDGQWYRAQIINVEGAIVQVRYVDFGNEALVGMDCLIKPPNEVITALNPQALECCLNGYQNMEDDLDRDNILEQLILEADFTMKVIEMQNNRALVDLIDSAKYNVGSLLLEQLAASKSQVSPILIQENHQIEQRKKRSIDESSNFNRNERKPLKDHNERGFDRQDSWRQPRSPRKDDDIDRPHKDNFEKPWRKTVNNADTSDKPYKDNWDTSRRDKAEKSHEKQNDSWGEDQSSTNQKSFQRNTFNRDNSQDNNNNGNWKSNRSGFKKDHGESDSNSNWKSGNRGGFKKDNWDGEGDSNWKSKPKEEGDWNNSEKNQHQGNRSTNFSSDNRKPREHKPFFGGKKDSWGSSDTKTPTMENKVTDPAPFTTPFLTPDILDRNEKVVLSWFHDPAHFFVQLFDTQAEVKTLVEDIQNHYCNIKPSSAPVGASVIALFPEDNIMYRARVLEVIGFQYRVQYVDFGNVSMTEKVWPIENKFMKIAAQAICCGLNGIIPVGETWPGSSSFSSYFDKEYYYCQFISCDNNYYSVEMTSDGISSIGGNLLAAGVAAQYIAEQEIYDPSILLGQQIRVTVKDVQALDLFTVELSNGTLLFCSMHNLATATETFEDTLKQYIGNCLLMYVDNVLEDKIEVTLYDTTGTKLKVLEPDEGAFETVDIPCPLPVLYTTINGLVSHVEILEGDVRNIYIQPAEYADTLALLLENLFNHYEGAVCEKPVQPEVNQIYAVQSSDTNWYRGEVQSIENEAVVVTYIDYGNSETVEKSVLRNLATEFLEQHVLTLQVVAAEVDESFIEQYVTGTVWYGENGWEAEIQIQSVEEAEDLTQQADLVEENEPALTDSKLSSEQPLQEEILLCNDVGDKPAQQIGVCVILSHTDCPNQFYLQQSDSLSTIDNLQETLNEQVAEYPVLENPAAGILCAAPYSLDQQWYRAQILDADEDITTVRFVDFGNTDVIANNTTNVKTLPPELLSLEQYARMSSLMAECIGSEWSSAAFERFEQLTHVEHLTVEIIHQDEKTTYVRLYANGIDVAEVLIQEGLANKLQLETESSCTGYVSNLNSPSEFWIQLENSVADLEWVAEQLSSANGFSELEDLTPGSLCAALFPDDELWHRARILSNTVAGLEVLFIDYGNYCTCLSLRQLPEDLIMLPPLAQKCSLQKPTGILQWSQQAIEEFKTISADGATVFNIDKVSTGETYIVRLLLNDEDISVKLLPIMEDSYISHFESVSDFWIQKADNTAKLDVISETLTGAYDWPQYEDNQSGCEFVAALYSEDEIWYRARLINKHDCDFEVFFIDYGNTGKANDIRLLGCDMDKESPLAIHCKLEPLPGFRWCEESSNTLAQLNNEGATLFQVEFVSGDVVRLYLNGSDIRSNLESIPISSAQNSPKKSTLQKPTSETSLHYQNEDTSESLGVAASILGEIENYFHKEITAKQSISPSITSQSHPSNSLTDSTEIVESILTELEDSLNFEVLAEDIKDNEKSEFEEDKSIKEALPLSTVLESTDQDEHSANQLKTLSEVSVVTNQNHEEELVNSSTKLYELNIPTDNFNNDEIASEIKDDVSSEASNDNDIYNSKIVQNTIFPISDGVCNNHKEIDKIMQMQDTGDILEKIEYHSDFCDSKEKHNGELESNEYHQPISSHEESSETSLPNRRLSTPHSEKIVPGFYTQLEYFENINSETEDPLLSDNCIQMQSLLTDLEESHQEDHVTKHELPILTMNSDFHNNTGNCMQRGPPTSYDERIIPGLICHGNLDVDELNDFNDKDTSIEFVAVKDEIEIINTTQEMDIEDESPCICDADIEIQTTDDPLGIDALKARSSLPYTEKIVPGSISRGDMSLIENENICEKDSDSSKDNCNKASSEQIMPVADEDICNKPMKTDIVNEHAATL